MDAGTNSREIQMCYSIIARDREPQTNRARANLILTELKHTLIPYVTNPHIQFQKPNFIIYLQDPGLQQCLLSKQMLQTHTFTLDLVAWLTENEMAQIPWMTGPPTAKSSIPVDPLAILPLPSTATRRKGKQALKDTYAEALGNAYDFRAPDFSYLIINDIKDFYSTRAHYLCCCRNISVHMDTLLQQFSHRLNAAAYNLCYAIHKSDYRDHENDNAYFYSVAQWLHQLLLDADGRAKIIHDIIDLAQRQQHPSVNIKAFQKIPDPLKTTVPPAFASRLKTIHAAATEKVYGQQAVVTAHKTVPTKFEAFITMGNLTAHYNEVPCANAATAETLAVYHSLRYITNVLSYRIIDLNYPSLSTLIHAVNQQNADMTRFDHCVSGIKTNADLTHQLISSLPTEFRQAAAHIPQSQELC